MRDENLQRLADILAGGVFDRFQIYQSGEVVFVANIMTISIFREVVFSVQSAYQRIGERWMSMPNVPHRIVFNGGQPFVTAQGRVITTLVHERLLVLFPAHDQNVEEEACGLCINRLDEIDSQQFSAVAECWP